MKTSKIFSILLLAVLGEVSIAQAAMAEARSLEDVLSEYKTRNGVEILLAPSLAGDLVSGGAEQPAWRGGIESLLAGYNYETVRGSDGRLRQIIVSGRNGSAVSSAQPRDSRVASVGELLRYAPARPALPGKYAGLSAGSVSAISLPIDRLAAMRLGDRLVLGLPVGQYEVVHDNRFRHENGDVTWVGYLDGVGKGYRVIITTGREGSLGQIVTPDGVYNIDLEEGQNWLVDVRNSGLQAGSLEHDEIDGALASLGGPTASEVPAAAAGSADVLDTLKNIKQRAPRKKKAAAASDAGTVVDLLLVYTRGMNTKPLKTRLNFLVASANQAYLDSGIQLRLRLVKSVYADYTEDNDNAAALNDLSGSRGAFGQIGKLRKRYGADLVSLVRPFRYAAQKSCGVAWVNGARGDSLNAGLAYSVVSDGKDPSGWYCTDYTLAHELGHNLGSVHDSAHSAFEGKYPFSSGYGASGKFGTIMSYFNPVVGVFSNPRLSCAGEPCGTEEGADNSRSIGLTAPTVSAFMPTRK